MEAHRLTKTSLGLAAPRKALNPSVRTFWHTCLACSTHAQLQAQCAINATRSRFAVRWQCALSSCLTPMCSPSMQASSVAIKLSLPPLCAADSCLRRNRACILGLVGVVTIVVGFGVLFGVLGAKGILSDDDGSGPDATGNSQLSASEGGSGSNIPTTSKPSGDQIPRQKLAAQAVVCSLMQMYSSYRCSQ